MQVLAGVRRLAGQFGQVRPGRLGIHEIRRQGRHAAPVVDACVDDLRQHAGTQVRRRLHAHVGAEYDTGDGDGPEQFVEIRFRRRAHLRARLGAEVLDDDLLDVAVRLVHPADGEQGLDAFAAGLADADQDAGGHRHAGGAGVVQGLDAYRGDLVRGAVVGHALVSQPVGGGLEHDPHRRGDGPAAPRFRRASCCPD